MEIIPLNTHRAVTENPPAIFHKDGINYDSQGSDMKDIKIILIKRHNKDLLSISSPGRSNRQNFKREQE